MLKQGATLHSIVKFSQCERVSSVLILGGFAAMPLTRSGFALAYRAENNFARSGFALAYRQECRSSIVK